MRAIITRRFIIKDEQLKAYMEENDISENEIEDLLVSENSFNLEELCSNDLIFDTDVEVEQ